MKHQLRTGISLAGQAFDYFFRAFTKPRRFLMFWAVGTEMFSFFAILALVHLRFA